MPERGDPSAQLAQPPTLPLGLQLIGRPWDEAGLLNYAHVLESRAGFVAKAAKWW